MVKDDYTRKIQVKRVVDGDTLVCDIDLGFDIVLTNQYVRLSNIDTPERGHDGYVNAKEFVEKVLLGNDKVYIASIGKEPFEDGKYGRWLGEIWFSDEPEGFFSNLNEILVEIGLAKEYLEG